MSKKSQATYTVRIIERTLRLELRPYQESDYLTWFDAYVNRQPKRNAWDNGPLDPLKCTLGVFKKLVQRHEELAKEDKVYIYAIFERQTGTLVGIIDIGTIYRENYQSCNLGYQLFNREWGKGYGREAAKAALELGFRRHRYHRIESAINLRNTRSVKLARAIGMKYEGVRKHYLYENGKWVSQHIFALTPEDIGLQAYPPL